MKQKLGSFKKYKVDNPLVKLIKRKRQETKLIKLETKSRRQYKKYK